MRNGGQCRSRYQESSERLSRNNPLVQAIYSSRCVITCNNVKATGIALKLRVQWSEVVVDKVTAVRWLHLDLEVTLITSLVLTVYIA